MVMAGTRRSTIIMDNSFPVPDTDHCAYCTIVHVRRAIRIRIIHHTDTILQVQRLPWLHSHPHCVGLTKLGFLRIAPVLLFLERSARQQLDNDIHRLCELQESSMRGYHTHPEELIDDVPGLSLVVRIPSSIS